MKFGMVELIRGQVPSTPGDFVLSSWGGIFIILSTLNFTSVMRCGRRKFADKSSSNLEAESLANSSAFSERMDEENKMRERKRSSTKVLEMLLERDQKDSMLQEVLQKFWKCF